MGKFGLHSFVLKTHLVLVPYQRKLTKNYSIDTVNASRQ